MDRNELTERLIRAGEEWAEANAAASLLEETRKAVWSEVAMDLLKSGAASSVAQAEKMAYASERYKDHLEGMADARKAANKARVRYDSGKTYTELLRTQEATKRAEMGMR